MLIKNFTICLLNIKTHSISRSRAVPAVLNLFAPDHLGSSKLSQTSMNTEHLTVTIEHCARVRDWVCGKVVHKIVTQ